MTKDDVAAVLDRVRNWPKEDQEWLAELAREIEAERKGGVYVLSKDEAAALDEAMATPIVSDEEVRAFWRRHGIEK